MTVARDAFSSVAAGTGTLSWTHTPTGTPTCILVIAIGTATSDEFTSADYGGNSMVELSASPAVLSSGEGGNISVFVLATGVPSGAQTVTVNVTGTGSKRAAAWSLTGTAPWEWAGWNTAISSTSLANPSDTLSLSGQTSFVAMGYFSGQNAVTGSSPLAGWTAELEHDFGTDTCGWYSYNTIDSADVTIGWTQTADDALAVAVGLREALSLSSSTQFLALMGCGV